MKFEFESNPDIVLYQCNCSICERVGYLHLIIPAGAFKLLTDWDQLSLYTFNTHVAKHYFCKSCGVKPFYVPRSNPDGVSINYRCVDPSTFGNVVVEDFDGQNWEKNAADLSDLSS